MKECRLEGEEVNKVCVLSIPVLAFLFSCSCPKSCGRRTDWTGDHLCGATGPAKLGLSNKSRNVFTAFRGSLPVCGVAGPTFPKRDVLKP